MDLARDTEPSGSAGTAGHIDVDVLVVGAGPTGLTAACEAIRHGLSVRIIDRKPYRSTFSKALVAHARTLEVFETMGVAEAIVAEGQRFAALNIHAGRRRRAVRVDLIELPWGDTAYPFWLSIPQYATERILEAHLNKLGGAVEWEISLDELRDEGDHVQARLERADGGEDVVRSRWVVGCDGGRSRVREQIGLHLDRADARATFILADVKTNADLTEDEGHVFLGPDGLLLIVPMPEPHRWRIIAHVPTPSPDSPITIDAAFLDALIRRRSGIEFGSHDVVWQSQFNLSHGLADHYRRGRVFLAGDAAHVHSPVGGQGLNTGVQDAHNLLWKLGVARRAGVMRTEKLLDSYEAERRPVARAMVRGTARATGALTARSGLLRALLGPIAPRIISRPAVQARLGRAVGMLEIAYPGSPLVNPAVASAVAGRRMPNPELRTGGRLYQDLDPIRHTWVVRQRPGEASPDPYAPRWAGLPVVFLNGGALVDGSGTVPPVVLVRPDRYVAGAGDTVESVWSQLAVHPEQAPVPR
ncbi:FAD-dependent monooxygenase [Micromonospora purpureochromogenes]|uniref:FAD-dependent monooxygenase n=1 Tax=Micromonospora purpureochromogenes TaxID=47872 RepID=UPI0033241FDD